MRTQILPFLILLLLTGCSSPPKGRPTYHWQKLQNVGAQDVKGYGKGVASPFAGVINGNLIVAGGCNFSIGDNGSIGNKRYYKEMYCYSLDRVASPPSPMALQLPSTLAYGVSIQVPSGVVFLGGRNDSVFSNKVMLLTWNVAQKKIVAHSLPPLPVKHALYGGTYTNGKIYVVGAETIAPYRKLFFSLQLNRLDSRWEQLATYPGRARTSPVVVAQSNGEEENIFLFFGTTADGKYPYILSSYLAYSIKGSKWGEEVKTNYNGSSISYFGGDAFRSGAHHILFVGGVDASIYREEIARREAYLKMPSSFQRDSIKRVSDAYMRANRSFFNFNSKVMAFHTLTKSWTPLQNAPYGGVAGAKVVSVGNKVYVVNGEIKPGERTPSVYAGEVNSSPEFGLLNWIVLVIYLLSMVYLGYYFMKGNDNTEEYFTASGQIPWWASGISIFATMLSAISYMALPAKTYTSDWRYSLMAVSIILIVPLVVKYYFPFFHRLKLSSAYEYLERRFGLSVRLIASALFIVFMVSRIGVVLLLPALALSTVTGISVLVSILLMGMITLFYSTTGGIKAVIWGDVIQGVVLLAGLFVAIIFLLVDIDGGISSLIEHSRAANKLQILDFSFDLTKPTFWVVMFGGLASSLITYTSDQSIIQRYMTTSDERGSIRGIWLNGWLSAPASLLFYFVGAALFAYYSENPMNLDVTMTNSDSIFPYYIMYALPSGVAGLMIAAIFAATMSTLSSNINAVSNALTVDFYQRLTGKHNSVVLAKIISFGVGFLGVTVAIWLSKTSVESIFDEFQTIIGLFVSGLGGFFAMGIFTKRISTVGAIAGLIGSGLILFFIQQTQIHFLIYGLIGFVSSFVLAWCVSIFIPNKKNLDELTIHTCGKRT
ncbi:sodium:solute symporter family transporter [Alistipes sp. ZOR0009]|uniref:sodium:solute symporter family transporter n=1 Tax=Alistipes sp. ZOR0009 TaxID=1339253 RepID=UPI00068E47CE|nr:sodium/solute symporter [Alistipes sp. ZOR0009]